MIKRTETEQTRVFFGDSQQRGHRQQGSALLVAVIFAMAIGIASASYLTLASSEYRAAVRATLYSSTLNLAESGVEMGVDALVNKQTSGSTWKKTVAGYLQDGGFTGDVTLVIFGADSVKPTIYAEGLVTGHPSGEVRKQVRVELSSGFNPYEKGFSARNGITLIGNNVLLDSYNSDYGKYNALLPLGTPAGYGVSGYNKNDNIFVASDMIDIEGETAIDVGNAVVYGFVTVNPKFKVLVRKKGAVTSYADGAHDERRLLGDFYADFPYEPHPSGSYSSSYSIISGPTSISGSSNPDSPTYYDVSNISLSGTGQTLQITGHVALVMSGDIDVTGNGSIKINADSSLKIYTKDDVNIGGNGVANNDMVPSQFYIYGTAQTSVDSDGKTEAGQSISITGNGQLGAVVYAPAAEVTLSGGGSSGHVMGGLVGFTATVAGNSSFHFDEALREIVKGGGTYSITSWLEMTGATAASTPIDMSDY